MSILIGLSLLQKFLKFFVFINLWVSDFHRIFNNMADLNVKKKIVMFPAVANVELTEKTYVLNMFTHLILLWNTHI